MHISLIFKFHFTDHSRLEESLIHPCAKGNIDKIKNRVINEYSSHFLLLFLFFVKSPLTHKI